MKFKDPRRENAVWNVWEWQTGGDRMAHVSRHTPSRSTCLCCFALGKWANPWAHYYVGNDLDLSLIIRQITTTTTTTTTAPTAVRRQAWEPFRLRGLPQCARTAYWITEIVGFHPFSPFHFTWRWTEKIICCFYASVMPVCPAKPRITPKTSRIPPLAAPIYLFFLFLDKVDN